MFVETKESWLGREKTTETLVKVRLINQLVLAWENFVSRTVPGFAWLAVSTYHPQVAQVGFFISTTLFTSIFSSSISSFSTAIASASMLKIFQFDVRT